MLQLATSCIFKDILKPKWPQVTPEWEQSRILYLVLCEGVLYLVLCEGVL